MKKKVDLENTLSNLVALGKIKKIVRPDGTIAYVLATPNIKLM